MSLINDMLRDLEQRRDQQLGLRHEATAVPGMEKKRKRGLILGAVLGVGAVCGVSVYYLVPAETMRAKLLPTNAQQVSPPQPLVSESINKVATAPEPLSNPTVDRASESVETKLELSTLEVIADQDKAVFTLHFPEAPEYRLEQQASVDKRLIIAFPGAFIGRDLSIPEFGKDTLLREFSLKPATDKLLLLVELNHEGGIDSVQTRSSESEFLLEITIQFSKAATSNSKQVSQVVEHKAEPVAEPTNLPARKKAATASESTDSTHSKSNAKLDKVAVKAETSQEVYQSGMRQLSQGQVSAAKGSFSQALQKRPDFVDARIQLISLLQREQQYGQAEVVLDQGLTVSPGNPVLRKLKARQLMSGQFYTKGIELLTRPPMPEITQDQEYYALLAVMYHDAAEYQDALNIYQVLVKVRPENATWWFGLAICADQVLDHQLAGQAYQSALQLPSLRADLQVYARQRLEQL